MGVLMTSVARFQRWGRDLEQSWGDKQTLRKGLLKSK